MKPWRADAWPGPPGMRESRDGVLDGSAVVVGQAEDLDRALKRFKRQVEKAGVLSEVRRREYALSRGQRRREKDGRARTRTLCAAQRRDARAARRSTEAGIYG